MREHRGRPRGALAGLLGRWLGTRPGIRVRLLIRGRIGEGWHDVDQVVKLAEGATLETLLDEADRRAIPLRQAIDNSPHLRDTLMLNGERCAVEENLDRPLADGDEVFLLAPVAGGGHPAVTEANALAGVFEGGRRCATD